MSMVYDISTYAVRTYYGCHIYRLNGVMVQNGLRWETYVNGRFWKADTLAGIKEIIRDQLGK